MTRLICAINVASAILLAFTTIANAQNGPKKPKPGLDLINQARQTYIFQLAPDASPAEVKRVAREVAQASGSPPGHVYKALRGFSATVTDVELLEIQEEFPELVGIQRSNIFSIDEKSRDDRINARGNGRGNRKNSQSTNSGDTIPWGVARVVPNESALQICHDGSCGTIWVLDTGVDLDNPHLNIDAVKSTSCVLASSSRGDGTADDEHGHGTHVAGTAAARLDGSTVVGVAAGATVVSVRVLDKRGLGTSAEVICGIDYVAENGLPGDVVNMSLSGPADPALDAAVLLAAENDIYFSLAAGNNGSYASSRSPARVNHPNVFTVSAIDSKDKFAVFSNFGNPTVDIAAPGVDILSLTPDDGTATKSGTSMAAPHVAGLLSLQETVGCKGRAKADPDGFRDGIAYLTTSSCPSPGF